MDKPRKTAKQLLDVKKQAGFFSVSANSTVKAALEVLSEKNIGAVLVMEDTKLIGIFSERDYARKGELQGRTAGSTAIREVMTSSIASVTPDQTVEECRKIMGERRIRHLPVLHGEKVIGVLSSKDILDEIIAEDEKLIRDLETERLLTTTGNYRTGRSPSGTPTELSLASDEGRHGPLPKTEYQCSAHRTSSRSLLGRDAGFYVHRRQVMRTCD
jgi:CBS domain-containing protein